MGMDLYGINPKTDNGDYFRANVWYWRPLWQCVAYFCGDILSENDIKGGTVNSGYEYDETTALEISDRLEMMFSLISCSTNFSPRPSISIAFFETKCQFLNHLKIYSLS